MQPYSPDGGPVSVSVVLPCYRNAATIGRALASLASQTAPPAEIIVVDDASDDDSAARARCSGVAGLRVKRLESNLGPGGARNAGWREASQPYIAFLDADDAWHPRKLELQFGWMQSHPGTELCGHAIAADAPQEPAAPLRAVPVTPAMLLRSNRFQTSSVMLRRSVRQRFAEDKRYCEDYLLWLELVLSGAQAYYLDAALGLRFKPVYGAHGASGRLWRMQTGEVDALARVRRAGLLGLPAFLAAGAWSWVKFVRRLVIAAAQ
jgi:glycosyltransferase involved in cell wall biosynthesis